MLNPGKITREQRYYRYTLKLSNAINFSVRLYSILWRWQESRDITDILSNWAMPSTLVFVCAHSWEDNKKAEILQILSIFSKPLKFLCFCCCCCYKLVTLINKLWLLHIFTQIIAILFAILCMRWSDRSDGRHSQRRALYVELVLNFIIFFKLWNICFTVTQKMLMLHLCWSNNMRNYVKQCAW